MKTYWLHFRYGREEFTDFSEGRTVEEACARLGLNHSKLVRWSIIKTNRTGR